MNKAEILTEMVRYGDSQSTLAKAMGLSRTRLNAKINERDGATFTQPEISFICLRYNLSAQRIKEIFFNQVVS